MKENVVFKGFCSNCGGLESDCKLNGSISRNMLFFVGIK